LWLAFSNKKKKGNPKLKTKELDSSFKKRERERELTNPIQKDYYCSQQSYIVESNQSLLEREPRRIYNIQP
jgi:hypothetical protein